MIDRIAEKIARLWFGVRHASRFRAFGARSHFVSPFRLDGAAQICVGDDTLVQRGSWLYCVGIDGISAALTIGNGCALGYNTHIAAVRDVRIGDHVLTANNVYISDNVHGFDDPTVAIMHQAVKFRRPVSIGSGSWLGENVCIIGASVGRNSVIGANAVVIRDVPDRCVAVGVPARIISHYDEVAGVWMPGART